MNRTPEPPVAVPAAQIENMMKRGASAQIQPREAPKAPSFEAPVMVPEIPPLPVFAPANSAAVAPVTVQEPVLPKPEAALPTKVPFAPPPMDGNEGYDPIAEIAEEALAMTIRGRPVSVFVTGVIGGDFTSGTIKGLERALSSKGRVLVLKVAANLTADGVSMAIKDAGKDYAFVIVEGGPVHPASSDISRATTLTVLVASDDLEDKRTEDASQWLQGCNYFIVGALSAEGISAV